MCFLATRTCAVNPSREHVWHVLKKVASQQYAQRGTNLCHDEGMITRFQIITCKVKQDTHHEKILRWVSTLHHPRGHEVYTFCSILQVADDDRVCIFR